MERKGGKSEERKKREREGNLSTEKDRNKLRKNMTESEIEWAQMTSYWRLSMKEIIKLTFLHFINILRLCDKCRLGT